MKRAYIVGLLVLGLSAVIFYVQWSTREKERAARQAVIDHLKGKEYLDRDGKKEAQDDIARGTPKLKLYGLEVGDFDERAAVFRRRLGVELDPIAGCIVSDPLVKYADAYNAEVRRFLAAKFGPNAFDDVERESLRLWESKKDASLKTNESR
ncbi:MAG TPA: hypothetical protein VFB27_04410 [Opitutaceae bacterium]|nr:hypothetical protein [Opitutaceae bacterium]